MNSKALFGECMNNGTTLLTFLENNKCLLVTREDNRLVVMKLSRFMVDARYNYFVFSYIPRVDISCNTSSMQLLSIYDIHFDYTKKGFPLGDKDSNGYTISKYLY